MSPVVDLAGYVLGSAAAVFVAVKACWRVSEQVAPRWHDLPASVRVIGTVDPRRPADWEEQGWA